MFFYHHYGFFGSGSRGVDNAIQPINHCLADKCLRNLLRYQLHWDLSSESIVHPKNSDGQVIMFLPFLSHNNVMMTS